MIKSDGKVLAKKQAKVVLHHLCSVCVFSFSQRRRERGKRERNTPFGFWIEEGEYGSDHEQSWSLLVQPEGQQGAQFRRR